MANYDERVLLVEVDGLHQGAMQTNHATFKVPYGSLARILQLIKLKGGKIVRIHSLASSLVPETVKPPSPEAVKPSSPEAVKPSSPNIAESPSPKSLESPSPLMVESKVTKLFKLPSLLRRLLGNT